MQPSSDTRTARDLRAMTGDVVAFSVMVGLGETYLPAFVLASGLGALAAGWIATLPLLAGSVLQLVTPYGVRRLGSYRRWVVLCARLQALSFLPLVAGAWTGAVRSEWVFVVAAAYWGFGMATSPAWNAWVGALVPQDLRARYFARRAHRGQVALLTGVLLAGALLDALEGGPVSGFAVLFAGAACARWISAAFLARQSEPPGLVEGHRHVSPARALRHLGRGEGTRLLAYLLGIQVSVYIAAPFFTPYMLGPLRLSYTGFTVLIAAAFVARIAVLPLLGPAAHRFGSRPVLRAGALAIVPLPALWLVSDSLLYLVAVQLLAGSAWAALEYATQLLFFESLEERDRASILTVFNLANTLAMVVGCAIGGLLFSWALADRSAYQLLFLVSAAARLVPLVLLRDLPARVIPTPEVALRTLAVRPSAGAIQRPVLAALEAVEEIQSGAAERPGPAPRV
ncbi:MAG: MFS transporter [Deltaproteobacteria bacterium]|nr:MAG: MFS transporter [Deltaproteobacteria bacterium]